MKNLHVEGVLVTGASGFVGSALMKDLRHRLIPVRGAFRTSAASNFSDADYVMEASLECNDWHPAFEGMSHVVHTAARVHIMNDAAIDPISEFRRVNVQGTLNLARQAAKCGIKRFVFISSVKVNGEKTLLGKPFMSSDAPTPEDPYGYSKYEAELGLLAISKETGMEVVVIRPPLVYGEGVGANFASMVRFVNAGVPLPLGAVRNARSFVAIENLVEFIFLCLQLYAAANKTFFVSDNDDVSTPELLRRVGMAAGRPVRLFDVAPRMLRFGASIFGKSGMAQRLCDSLQVDVSPAIKELGWTPSASMQSTLLKVVANLRGNR